MQNADVFVEYIVEQPTGMVGSAPGVTSRLER